MLGLVLVVIGQRCWAADGCRRWNARGIANHVGRDRHGGDGCDTGAVKLPPGRKPAESVSAMIALSYGVTYIWGTVGIILICKYLPRWWGVDAAKSRKKI